MRSKNAIAGVLIGTMLILGNVAWAQAGSKEDWRDIPFQDVETGETVRISDFAGTPVLLESFAVWCPTCKRQQQEIADLHEQLGDSVISISLDVDPNESSTMVRNHARSNGFDWIYAVSPIELTRALIAEFGTAIVASPSAPVVLICGDQQHAQLLGRGVKRAGALVESISESCEVAL